jgi:4-hydroxybenzoate polyprenyltransferase
MKPTTPLIVDLDGSLLRTDTLHELIAASLGRPGVLFGALRQFISHGRAGLKRHLADNVPIDVNLLPVNSQVLEFVRTEHAKGRVVYLATGADAGIAEAITRRFSEFSGSFASDGDTNLTSNNKGDLLERKFGAEGFDYIGNSVKDRAVWQKASRAYLASHRPMTRPPRWSRGVSFAGMLAEPGRSGWWLWLRELRVHQSVKNVLIFLPTIAAHVFDAQNLLRLVGGFAAFTLMASSVYLLNDLLDLRSDRLHTRKSQRPLAAGRILPLHALVASVVLAVVALASGIAIGIDFMLVLVSYAVLTCLYSFWLKRVTLIDVVVLAMLYMVRILAGAVISDIELSFWFTGVTLFLFISLALVKRYTELSRAMSIDGSQSLHGRGYTRGDSAVILPLGIGTGIAVLMLMAIYLQSDAVTLLYPSAVLLWLVIPALFYWIANMWIQAGRGAMHDDPIVFAFKNPASLASAGIIALLYLVASTPFATVAKDVLDGLSQR